MFGWYYWIRFKLGFSISELDKCNSSAMIASENVKIAVENHKQSEIDYAYARGAKDGFNDCKIYFDKMIELKDQIIEELKNEK